MPSKPTRENDAKVIGDNKIVVMLDDQYIRRGGSNKTKDDINKSSRQDCSNTNLTIADIIGEFGLYQLSITLITFIRYFCVALMTNTGPLIAPAIPFSCQIPDQVKPLVLNPQTIYQTDDRSQCELQLINGTNFTCTSWNYNRTEYGVTLTDTFDLVCDQKGLRSVFQAIVTLGVAFSSVFWGYFSDIYGRKVAIQVTFICSLTSGTVSYFANSFIIYSVARAVCSFSDLGLVVSLATMTVELLGNKHRGTVCIIIYTGWAFGVWASIWLVEYFRDYQQLMLCTIFIHLLTLPWLLTIQESVRWSLVNGKISEAGAELRRISRWNCKGDEESIEVVDKKFDQYKIKYLALIEKNLVKDELSESKSKYVPEGTVFQGLSKVAQLFQSKELSINTVTLIWTTFNCELLYMFFILVNSDIGDSPELNYSIGLAMEVLATLVSILLIKKLTRRRSLVSTLIIISILCTSLAFTHQHLVGSIGIMNLTKLAVSTLSSIIYVTTAEMFPTDLRQTGFGVSSTLGSLGGAVAPFVRDQLVDLIGMTKVLLLIVFMPLTAALVIPFFLRETSGVDISDVVDEIVNESNSDIKLERRASVSSKRRPSAN